VTEAKDINMGAEVFASDGELLGKVKEISGDCFKVDAPLAPDYWLSIDTVQSVLAGGVLINFSTQDLDKVKRDAPEIDDEEPVGHTGYHRHI